VRESVGRERSGGEDLLKLARQESSDVGGMEFSGRIQ
jgi:hypothetical protein